MFAVRAALVLLDASCNDAEHVAPATRHASDARQTA